MHLIESNSSLYFITKEMILNNRLKHWVTSYKHKKNRHQTLEKGIQSKQTSVDQNHERQETSFVLCNEISTMLLWSLLREINKTKKEKLVVKLCP